jgi:hypothetical protein
VGGKQEGEAHAPQLKKEENAGLNFLVGTLRSKKYAEGLEEASKFIGKFRESQPEICRVLEMLIPVLNDQLNMAIQSKTYETKIVEINLLIERLNKEIQKNNLEEIEKIKFETAKIGSEYKNIGLLIEAILNIGQLYDTNANKAETIEN